MPFPFDEQRIQRVRDQVARACARAGDQPWLVGYDANEIQKLVTVGSRPKIMHGASEIIARFDAEEREEPRNIFAGGGRGISVVRTREEAERLAAVLPEKFRRETVVGVMAAAFVPLDLKQVRASLGWLRRKLEQAKDAAGAPGGELAADKRDECVNCQSYLATCVLPHEDGDERLCKRCYKMSRIGGETEETRDSLLEVSKHENGRLAAVSADGNRLGAFFDAIETLEELAAASMAVDLIFQHAHAQALEQVRGNKVPLVTGGDDVRAFLPPSSLLDYVETLARTVEESAGAIGDMGGLLRPGTARALSRLGIGVGAVVADDHYPAGRLMAHAHELEVHAKSICHGARARARSAFDLTVVTTEQSMGMDIARRRGAQDRRPFSLDSEPWLRTRRAVRALRALPAAQRRVLDAEHPLEAEEFANLFRYQVARSDVWKLWYEQCFLDWRDPQVVMNERPDAGLLALSALGERGEEVSAS